MAKKKKSRKRQANRQPHKKRPQSISGDQATNIRHENPDNHQDGQVSKQSISRASDVASEEDLTHQYVKQDVRRIGVIVLCLAFIMMVIWLILTKTNLGPNIYRLIKF